MGQLQAPARKKNVLVVGLDGAGKTCILSRLQPLQAPKFIAPTAGMAMAEAVRGNIAFTFYDMSGSGRYRSLWPAYLRNSDAIIWVVDGADEKRLGAVRDELRRLLETQPARGGRARAQPLLVFLNKTDVEVGEGKKLTSEHVKRLIDFEQLTTRHSHVAVYPCSALSGTGVEDGISWLAQKL